MFKNVMFVCCCIGVTDRTIREAIDAGATSVEQVTACTGAGSRCGTCRTEIAEMIGARLAVAMESSNRESISPRRLPILAA